MSIPFNKPYLTGKEVEYIEDSIVRGKTSGNGIYTKLCQKFFENNYGFKRCYLTTSCTDALEMTAILIDAKPGDEIIIPSYTFVSTANAFVLRGAKIVFADSRSDHPGVDEHGIEKLITANTKAIVVVHYAGVACDMDKIMAVARRHNLFVIEDAAHAIDSYYHSGNGEIQALGSIGHLATFSFHETKNVISGEGGMLVVNEENLIKRAEIIWEKGTNRSAFFRGEVDKYNWVDIGSSFLPSEITAAFLWAQLENLQRIQKKRKEIWKRYYTNLEPLKDSKSVRLPKIPEYAINNAHMFYLVFADLNYRTEIINNLKKKGILSVFHYLGLHNSPFYRAEHPTKVLSNTEKYSDCLLRLPFFFELTNDEIDQICTIINETIEKL